MKLLYVLALSGFTHAHYNFPSLIYGGAVTTGWQYVRQWTGYYTYDPVVDVTLVDIRCNVNGSTSGAGVDTLSVAAGSTLGFTASPNIYHPGPLQVYMAAVPSSTTTSAWDGSGEVWFKIFEDGPQGLGGTALTWETSYPNYATSWNFTIPAQVPSGNYLVRFEHIGLHVAQSVNGAQFYISCGQISVTGGGSGTPSPLVAFPGAYTPEDPGLLIDIYYPVPTSYTNPGPPVWPGTGTGTGSTTANSVATTSTKAATTSTKATTTSTKATTTSTKAGTTLTTSSTKAATTSVSKVATSTTSSGGCAVTIYGQCGGTGYTGCTICDASTCSAVSPPYYSQCV